MSEMIYETESDKSIAVLRADLEGALKENGFGVLTEVNVPEVMRKKGIEFDREILILGVCNPSYAKQALNADDKVAVMLPCTIVLYSAAAGTLVRLARPTALMTLFPDSGLDELGREVETKMVKAISVATAADGA